MADCTRCKNDGNCGCISQEVAKWQADRIATLEAAIREITFLSGEASAYARYREDVDLGLMHPIIPEVHKSQ